MDSWKRSFLEKLHRAQAQCAKQFEETLNHTVAPVFDKLLTFLSDNGFKVSTPLSEPGRRSFKFELAENAYVLMIFRFSGVSEFELCTETFVPGAEPILEKNVGRVADVDEKWTRCLFQAGLDQFVDLLAGSRVEEPSGQLAAV